MSLRFGFDADEEQLSLAEIARGFGISRERVRQIESVALKRLTSGPRRAELAEHWGRKSLERLKESEQEPPQKRRKRRDVSSEPPPMNG